MRPTTTLCVTAGNDAVWIGACLASASGVVDETVVVTVASTDRTAEIARRAGGVSFLNYGFKAGGVARMAASALRGY